MRNLVLYIVCVSIIASCKQHTPKYHSPNKIEKKISQHNICISKYYPFNRDSNTQFLTLVKKIENDTISFSYYKDSILTDEYKFLKYDYSLIKSKKRHSNLVLTDTLVFRIKNKVILLYKYEVETYAIDADGCYLLSPEFGFIAYNSYSWNTKKTLNCFEKNDEFFMSLSRILLDPKRNYFSPNNLKPIPPPPPNWKKIN